MPRTAIDAGEQALGAFDLFQLLIQRQRFEPRVRHT